MIDELEALGYGSDILPVPTVERDQTAADPDDEVMRILHVVGKAAAHDRNGTLEFIEAVAGLRYRTHVTLVTQEQDLPRRIRPGRNVTLDVITGGVASRWDLYANQHMLVLPRKYGGLCLDRDSRVSRPGGERTRIADLSVGDAVMDASEVPTVVTAKAIRTVDRHVEISLRGRVLRSSTDHLHLAASSPEPSLLREVKAEEVTVGEWMFVPRPADAGITSVSVGPKPVVRALRFWPEETELDEGWARLIGLWLAEGHRGRYSRTGRDRPESVVVWSFGERDRYLADEVQALLAERGINSHAVWNWPPGHFQGKPCATNGRCVQVKARSVWLNEFLDVLGVGSGAWGKRAPDLAAHLAPTLIGAWLDGDGCTNGRHISGFSRSTEMISDLWRLAAKAGVSAGISDQGQSLDFSGPWLDEVAGWTTRHRDVPERRAAQPSATARVVEGGWMIKVRAVSMIDEPLDVVAIETESGRYVAEDILTHNCLPALEAMACGLTVLMPDCSPNFIWPGPRVTARKGRVFRSPFGKVQTFSVHPLDLISTIDRLAQKRDRLRDEMDEAVEWAINNRWCEVRPRLYDPLLEEMA
jgi:hypothetical protein